VHGEARDHQLRQGHGVVGVFDMFPAGKGFRIALGRVEAMPVDLFRVQVDGVLGEDFFGELRRHLVHVRAGLYQRRNQRLEGRGIGGVWQVGCILHWVLPWVA